MTWSIITDAELTSGQLVLASTWKKLIDNPEAVCSGDATVPLLELILIEGQNSPVSTPTGAVLYGGAGFAEFRTTQPIGVVMPFYFWQTVGVVNWVVPSSGWYEITVQGGGAGGPAAAEAAGNYPLAAAGSHIQVGILLTAGAVLAISVGAGGAVANAGAESRVQGAAFHVSGGGSPRKQTGNSVFPYSGVTSVSGLLTVICDQPNQSSGAVLSSSAVGYGGVVNAVGHAGIVIIERIADNGL